MKKLLTLAVALVALAAFADLGVAQQKGEERSRPTGVEMKQPATGLGTAQQKGVEKSPAKAQMCSKAKMEVLDRLRAVEACDKAEKQRRVNEAKNCRGALKNVPAPFHWDKTLRPTPASACPAIGPGDGAAARIYCWSGVSSGGCAWAVCTESESDVWCWADCHGHGCS